MSLKDRIYDALKGVDETTVYGFSDENTFPYTRFSLVSHVGTRLSNKRHHQNLTYQVDHFSESALDVSSDTLLNDLQGALEDNGLITSEWQEVADINESEGSAIWHYYLEVRG